jgi:hypothetical protein
MTVLLFKFFSWKHIFGDVGKLKFPLFKALETPNIQFSVTPMAAVVTSIIQQSIEVWLARNIIVGK